MEPEINSPALHQKPLQIDYITTTPSEQDKVALYYLLKQDINTYPYFKRWFFHEFLPEINSGKRSILVARDQDTLAAAVLIKQSSEDPVAPNKICSFVVGKDYRGIGLGRLMMDKVIDLAGNDDLYVTISEEKESLLKPFFARFDFNELKRLSGYYRDGRDEIFLIRKGEQQPFKSHIC